MSDRVLYRCPVCERTFRVPAELMERPQCRECELNAEKRAEAKKQADEDAKREALKRQRDAEEQRLAEIRRAAAAEAEKLRPYGFLDAFVAIYLGLGVLGMVGGFMTCLVGIIGSQVMTFVWGLSGIIGAGSMILAAELVRMGRNVADDVERTKRNIEQLVNQQVRRQN